jgi:ppGpp synthetase/RelA/SpoT-type nucleotidyltranferase
MKIDEDLERWRKQEPKYKELKEYLCPSLKSLLRSHGMNAVIQARVKNELSVYKKLVEKRNKKRYSYDRMHDKLGIRIICKFQDEIPIICEIIKDNFEVKDTDNKITNYKFDQQGYKGTHLDTKLKSTDDKFNKYRGMFFEIQVRSLCDHVWADIYHDVGYKPENMPTDEMQRELYCLAGVLEVADKSFSKIHCEIMTLDILSPQSMLEFLKKPFYQIFASSYRVDYSFDNLKFFIPLLNNNGIKSFTEFKMEMASFIDENKKRLIDISNDYRDHFLRNPLISQPEVFVIFYLIKKDKFGLQKVWEKQFEPKYLEDISVWWGTPLLRE